MNRVLTSIFCLVVGIGLAAVLGPVFAEEPNAAAPVRLEFRGAAPTKAKGQLLLTAVLTAPGGKALSDRRVEFYQTVSVFGPGEAYLGTATTDAVGTASLVFQPAQLGRYEINARFLGGDGYARAVAAGTIEVREVMPLFKQEPLPFASLGQWLPYGLGALVLTTWLVIVGTLLATARGIRSAARSQRSPAPARMPRSVQTLAPEAQEVRS